MKISASTTGVTQQVGEDFEADAKVDFEDQNLGIRIPCPAGGDGRGNCREFGTSLKATLRELEINGMSGVSNSVQEFADAISGKKTISSNALRAANNLNRARGDIETFEIACFEN